MKPFLPSQPLDQCAPEPPLSAWRDRLTSPERVLARIEPGMTIFIGTGAAEPRTLVKNLMQAHAANLSDLELIQIFSFGDAISLEALRLQKYRLKTFFSGWAASEAIRSGYVDLIPSRLSRLPRLIDPQRIAIDVAFIQVTPPTPAGYCSLGVAVDVARLAMEQAAMVVGEINEQIPFTLGDTLVAANEFDFLVPSDDPPIYFERWPVDEVFDRVGANVASVIEDGSCLGFSIGPLYEALARHLVCKRHLGIHSAVFTDALKELVLSGAVSNRHKEGWRGRSTTSYALGSPELFAWLDHNPLVEFQAIDKVFDPVQIGRNPHTVTVLPARKVDLSGCVVMHAGKANISAGPGEAFDFFNGAELSAGGLNVFALPSRNRSGKSNIKISVAKFENRFSLREAVDMVVTEYGVASLRGRSVRERAQALIDIAHPDDRQLLVEKAKAEKILYPDQIYLAESARLYPVDVTASQMLKNGRKVRYRAIKPSDEEGMRRLFYRFSDESVYYRYFSSVRTMPHAKMQAYVNVDYSVEMSIVGLVGEPGKGRIIAEARYSKEAKRPYAEAAFVVDEAYQGLGIGTFMCKLLMRLAKERGLQGFTATVLANNIQMMKVFENAIGPLQTRLEAGVYEVTMPFRDMPA